MSSPDPEQSTSASRGGLAHSRVPMRGRDPQEPGRAATPLELLFDLTFVVAVGTAASNLGEIVAAGHPGPAAVAFLLAMFAISNAWLSFSWFASAFGTDDWLYRALTMVQMIGVVVFALGIPAMFASVEEGEHLEMRLVVAGYVVMRIAMMLQWARAARESPPFRKVGLATIRATLLVQLGWVLAGFLPLSLLVAFIAFAVLGLLELAIPVMVQGGAGTTPWHPHHVAERYSLFAIIALGEEVVGTIASSGALLGGEGGVQWSPNAVAVVVAGVVLTFGMWWVYFSVPFGDLLSRRRGRGYLVGYGHIVLFAGVAGAGAGLDVAGLALEEHTQISDLTVVLSLAIPIAVYVLTIYTLQNLLVGSADRFHLLLILLTMGVLAAAAVMAALGAPLAACLLVVMLAPLVNVVGYETVGHRRQHDRLAQLETTG